jgi:quercetin dioxygenase-like cupin family protein
MSLPLAQQSDAAPLHHRTSDEIRRFGFSSPIPLLSPAERLAFERHLARRSRPGPHAWFKGRAVTDRAFYDIASRPEIIDLLRPVLGDDIVLWGAVMVCRPPGSCHPWHTDMETAKSNGRAVSVWIGIRNASEISGLRFVAGSHTYGRPVQAVLADLNEDRNTISDERLLEIAQRIDPAARIVQGGPRDGEMVLFDGRTWHFGYNDGKIERDALLLQYAAVDTPIPMPAGSRYEWPWVFKESPRVPTILVSGSARHSANRIVPAPMWPLEGIPMITTVANSVALPLAEDPVKRWRPYPQFHGPTAALQTMSCHISVLSAGHRPHPPHIHPEEELLLMLDGEVEIELADDPAGTGSSRTQLKPGMFAYYPVTQHHTIHNTGSLPASYLMFKWRGGGVADEKPLATQIFSYESAVVPDEPKPMAQRLLFQQATHTLNKLHAHLTTLQPGAGYEAHADPYDVAIVLLSGEVETVGKRVRPLGVIYYSAGELHGMKNVGTTPATYLVFEFHSPLTPAALKRHLKKPRKSLLRRLLRRIVKAARKLGR